MARGSGTETFVAMRLGIDNWRWAGVPFLIRTGKRLEATHRRVTITFREPPGRMFGRAQDLGRNELAFDLSEPGGVRAGFMVRAPGPGPGLGLGPARVRLDHDLAGTGDAPRQEGHERLIHDVLVGDHTLSPAPTSSSGCGRPRRRPWPTPRRCGPTSRGRVDPRRRPHSYLTDR